MKNTPLTCTCTESSSREIRTYRHTRTHMYVRTYTHTCTHTHTHTHVRAWHGPGTTGDAPQHMHTWLDRQGGFRLRWQPLPMSGRGWSTGPRTPARGAALRVPLGHRVAGAGPWRRIAVLLSTRLHLALPAAVTTPGCTPGAAGWVGLPTTTSSSCGTEFSHHSLRVSMPLGGKYKRCLCLRPNMGVSGSPGLCPSFGPGLLARGLGRNEVGLHRTLDMAALSPRCPGCMSGGKQG